MVQGKIARIPKEPINTDSHVAGDRISIRRPTTGLIFILLIVIILVLEHVPFRLCRKTSALLSSAEARVTNSNDCNLEALIL